jgi:hypothetical protein
LPLLNHTVIVVTIHLVAIHPVLIAQREETHARWVYETLHRTFKPYKRTTDMRPRMTHDRIVSPMFDVAMRLTSTIWMQKFEDAGASFGSEKRGADTPQTPFVGCFSLTRFRAAIVSTFGYKAGVEVVPSCTLNLG